MTNPNLLWLIWVLMFVVLESMGLRGTAGMKPLTYWLVEVFFRLAEFGIAIIIGAAGWIAYHVIIRSEHRRNRDDV